jgi:hypothetical protein
MKKLADGTEIAEDGEVLHVPLYLADGAPSLLHDGMGNLAGHKPGYVFAPPRPSDEVRSHAHADYQRRLRDAWRGDGAQPADNGGRDLGAAYAGYEDRLRNAWRGAR